MITAHVNEHGIVIRPSAGDNLTREGWEELLDALKSHYIPSFYQYNKRMHVDASAEGQIRVVIYLTPKTVSMDEAIEILKNRNIQVYDVRSDSDE